MMHTMNKTRQWTAPARRVKESLSELKRECQKGTGLFLKGRECRSFSDRRANTKALVGACQGSVEGECGWSTVDKEERGPERREVSEGQIACGLPGYELTF